MANLVSLPQISTPCWTASIIAAQHVDNIWVQTRLVLAVSSWTRQSDSRAVRTGVDLLGQAAAAFKAVARGASNYSNHYANACDFARPPPLFLERKGANFPQFSDTGERV
jgi:hypothetical protein